MRHLSYGLVIGFALAGCVSASYQYFNLEMPDGCYQDGKLLAHDPKDDLPLTVCKPDAVSKMKCVHMLTSVFQRMQIDLKNLEIDLRACEQTHK